MVVLLVVVGLGGYEAYEYYLSSLSPKGSPCISYDMQHEEILCNGFFLNVLIINNFTFRLDGNGSYIFLKINASNIRLDLQIPGDYNHAIITGGQTDITVNGNNNTVDARQTTILNVQNFGVGNTIER